MKLNNRFIFGILSLLLAAVIAFVALPTIARQTNGKEEIVRITQPVLKGEQISSENAEVVEVECCKVRHPNQFFLYPLCLSDVQPFL